MEELRPLSKDFQTFSFIHLPNTRFEHKSSISKSFGRCNSSQEAKLSLRRPVLSKTNAKMPCGIVSFLAIFERNNKNQIEPSSTKRSTPLMSHLTLDQSDCFKRLPTAINQSTSLCLEQMKLNDSEPCDFGSFYCIETEMICSSVFFGGRLGSWELHVFHSIQPPLLAPVKQPGLVPKLLDSMTTPQKETRPESSWLEKAEAIFFFPPFLGHDVFSMLCLRNLNSLSFIRTCFPSNNLG